MPTIQERFEQFHRENPHVLQLLVNYTIQVKNRGFNHYSMRAIFERARWHVKIDSHKNRAKFKLNDNYISRYVRLIEEKHPHLKDFYFKRRLRVE